MTKKGKIMEKYYTLKGYKLRSNNKITEAMEDYIEMIYKNTLDNKEIGVKDLSLLLNVKYSSTSKMLDRLKEQELVNYYKYKKVSLTDKGIHLGKYLLYRHEILTTFFKLLNKKNYKLEEVEKIEHYLSSRTIKNLENLIKFLD